MFLAVAIAAVNSDDTSMRRLWGRIKCINNECFRYLNVVNGLVQDPSTLQPGQVAVTQEQYADIVAQQLAELWGNYGDLAEIW